MRFAPSPTGSLHIGNARTALFNWLFARRHDGRFILRIEDTDRERSRPEFEAAILEDLRWLGLRWDEGPDAGGEVGPYRQSERLPDYRAAVDRLLQEDRAYHCFCTPEALEAQRRDRIGRGLPPRYDGRCRPLPVEEVSRRRRAGEAGAVRFVMPPDRIQIHDLVKGDVQFLGSDLDDFVILRADGTPSYNFAAAVDDCRMGVTLVIRGDDHLANTPRQMALARALGWEPPRFAHVPLIHGADGAPLSKRHGVVTIAEHRAAGILPEGLVNYLALLGWSPPPGTDEVMDLEALSRHFDLDRVSRSPAKFDADRLAWFNRQHLRRAPVERLVEELGVRATPLARRAVEVLRRDASGMAAIRESLSALMEEPASSVGGSDRAVLVAARRALAGEPATEAEAGSLLDDLGRQLALPKRAIMHTLRAALTGREHGLPVASILYVLGGEETRRRLERAIGALPVARGAS
ncbi:MAG: glutamate--tRNA ligase [Candidatus Rokubacteria bacterium]|nr:glutamate--tRNA ligase [Candidatus Rokubacteria bacterium]